MNPVLVIGAGPVGLTMALELARFGVPLRLVDRSAQATQTSRALVLWARTLELMERSGCTGDFLEHGLRAARASVRSGAEVLGAVRFDELPGSYNFGLMLPQSETERLLIRRLELLGVRVEREVELRGLQDDGDQVVARLRHADGSESSVATPWLLGCDGAHSTVRHALGIAFAGETENDDWLLADVRLEGDRAPPRDEAAICLHRDGPLAMFPMRGKRTRVVGRIGPSDPQRPRAEPTLADVQALIDQRAGGGFRAVDPVWLANFRINERMVDEYRHGRVLLAGDAAHIHSPAGGQGMNTGMQDAINLAWKLALVIHGAARPTLLDSYSAERARVGAMVVRNATRLTRAAKLSNPLLRATRNGAIRWLLRLRGVRRAMAGMLSEIDIDYRQSTLSCGPHAGERVPPEHYAGPPPGQVAPRFIVHAADAARGDALAARHPELLEPRTRAPLERRPLSIVRPDGYIGFVAGADEWDAAGAWLQELGTA